MSEPSAVITTADIVTELGVTRQRVSLLIRKGRITPVGTIGQTYVFADNWRQHYEATKPKRGRPTGKTSVK